MKVQVFGDIDNITNKRGTNEIIVKFITQEVTDEQAGLLIGLRNKYVCMLLSTSEITDRDIKELPDEFETVKPIDGKKPSQRLRNVLYRQWESRYKQRYPEFDSYYEKRMEQIIEDEKERI